MFRYLILVLSLLLATPVFAAVDYNGDADYHSCGDVTDFDGVSYLWLFAVVEFDLFSASSPMGKENAFALNTDTGGKLNACVVGDNTFVSCYESDASSITTSAVHSILFIWGGGNTFTFYVDGADAGSTQTFTNGTPDTIPNVSNPLLIGSVPLATDNFDGIIHHAAIGTNTLTAQDIQQLTNSNIKDSAAQVGADMDFWMDDAVTGSAVASSTILDRIGGVSCTGTDADADSSFVAESALVYP